MMHDACSSECRLSVEYIYILEYIHGMLARTGRRDRRIEDRCRLTNPPFPQLLNGHTSNTSNQENLWARCFIAHCGFAEKDCFAVGALTKWSSPADVRNVAVATAPECMRYQEWERSTTLYPFTIRWSLCLNAIYLSPKVVWDERMSRLKVWTWSVGQNERPHHQSSICRDLFPFSLYTLIMRHTCPKVCHILNEFVCRGHHHCNLLTFFTATSHWRTSRLLAGGRRAIGDIRCIDLAPRFVPWPLDLS